MRLRVAAATLLALGFGLVPPAAALAAPAKLHASAPKLAAAASGSWTTYHHDNAHTGFDSTAPAAQGASTGWAASGLDGTILAEPLVFNGIVYAATLQGTVYAINQSDGTIAWSNNVGTPTTWSGQCGNINPLGISGTPVIDTAANRIYVTENLSVDNLWHVFAIDLGTHLVVMDTPIPKNLGTGFDWTIEQDRGALALANGFVYVPFGGRIGDCGPYHGWIFAVPTNGGPVTSFYETPGQGAGFWAAGGVVVNDATGHVFETSGNGTASGCDSFSDGTPVFENDAVVQFTSTLSRTGAFIPQDWRNDWCLNDQDLGSATMVILNPSLAFQSGKWGTGFLINPEALGGLDGQLFPTPRPATYSEIDVCRGNHNDANFGSYAYAAPYVYLGCESNGLVALSIDTTTPSFPSCSTTCSSPNWNATGFKPGPPIVAGGAVWAVDTNGGGLYGFNASTGAQIFHSAGFGVNHFTTPSEAGGQIFVGSGNVLRSFNILGGCSLVTLSPAPMSPAPPGTTVVWTANATGSSCVNPQYEFWLRPSTSNTWTMQQAYSTTNTWSWTSTNTSGSYFISVHARTGTSTAPFETLNTLSYTISAAACGGVTISAAPPTSTTAGTPVTFTGNATNCSHVNPLYEFWLRPQNVNSWQMVQAFSTAATFSWDTTGKSGGYYISVWVKDSGSSTATFDANDTTLYTVNPVACTSVTLGASPSSPQNAGTQVTFTGAASGCPNTGPLFEFWLRPSAVNIWTMVQPYSTTTTFPWSTSGTAGDYYISVWAKDSASATASFDANKTVLYHVNPATCTSLTIASNPPNTAPNGTQVTFTANGTGCTNANALYEFWLRPAGANTWTLVQPYSTANTFTWTSPTTPGGYYISAWVKDAASATSNFDRNATTLYNLT